MQEKRALQAETERATEQARQETERLAQELCEGTAAQDAVRSEHQAALRANEQLKGELQRTESAINALEREHKRFVAHASELCNQKDAEILVCLHGWSDCSW